MEALPSFASLLAISKSLPQCTISETVPLVFLRVDIPSRYGQSNQKMTQTLALWDKYMMAKEIPTEENLKLAPLLNIY